MKNRFEEPLTPKQVCQYYFHGKIGYTTLLSMIKKGEIPFHRYRHKYFVWPAELLEWQANHLKKEGNADDRHSS